jgi:uncharacterized protein
MYRNVRGGLDRAVDEATRLAMYNDSIVDIDCHQGEPFSLFTDYLSYDHQRELRERQQQVETIGYKQEYEAYSLQANTESRAKIKKELEEYQEWHRARGRISNKVRELNGRIRRPEIKRRENGQYSQTNEEFIDVWTRRMHDIGIKHSLIFPNIFLFALGTSPNPDLETAMTNAYMDYMLDNFLGKYPEILSCVVVSPSQPDSAADLIQRVGSEKGVVGVTINPAQLRLAGDDSMNPIYEAAQKKELPVCFHADAGNALPPFNLFNSEKYLPIHAIGFPWWLILQMTSIVTSGLPERFPGLKFVFIEGGISWVPWLMYRLDTEFRMRRSEAAYLKRMPSEYIKEFYFSSQPLEKPQNVHDLEWIFRAFDGENQVMYASDYPHWDFDTPSVIYNLPFLSKEGKSKILSKNAKKVFKIP